MHAFALADHGIRNHGGHNLTYARRVLDAAAAEGWRTALGTHVEADEEIHSVSNALPGFRLDSREVNPGLGRGWRTPALLHAADPRLSHRRPASEAQTPNRAPEQAGRSSLGRRLVAAAGAPGDDAAALVSAWRAPRLFAADLERFLHAAGLGRGDVAFLPTLHAGELAGLAGLLGRSALARSLRWRVVLRYPPGSGLTQARLRRAAAALETCGADIAWFTDTPQLAALYADALTRPPSVLPVPVEQGFAVAPPPGATLTVGYFGDARTEKGFNLLPGLVRAVRQAGAPVRFLVQTNFNVARGEPQSAAALAELQALGDESLTLVDGPFDPELYRENFQTADVILVPYDPAAYGERSSGVFMEAVAAGAPVLVSAGTWMAGVLGDQAGEPSPMVVERTPEAFAAGLRRVASDRERFIRVAAQLRERLRPLYDPVRLVRMVAA